MTVAQQVPALVAQRSGLPSAGSHLQIAKENSMITLAKFTDANGNYAAAKFGWSCRFGGYVVRVTDYTVTIKVDLVINSDGTVREHSGFLGREFTFAKADVQFAHIPHQAPYTGASTL